MPSLNFNYTEFLRKQNEKYIKKYGDEPIKAESNPEPVIGFSGHVPSYRGSINELRVIRSLVRCISSPMKPTTATGYRSRSKQFFRPEEEDEIPIPVKEEKKFSPLKNSGATPENGKGQGRAKSAPVTSTRHKNGQTVLGNDEAYNYTPSPVPSHISMMSAGSASALRQLRSRPVTARPEYVRPRFESGKDEPPKAPTTASSFRSRDSVPSLRKSTPQIVSKHPTGYPQTLYGSSFWYTWPDQTTKFNTPKERKRPDSFDHDRMLTRNDGVIYHKHEGVLPKYMGYVPSYKFRHGSTFGVLTVNATTQGVAHRLAVKS